MRATADFATTLTDEPLLDEVRAAGCRSLAEMFELRAERQPDLVAYRFLPGTSHQVEELTYGELDRRARAVASHLRAHARVGDRAALLYSPGLEYVVAVVACLYAGVIAVPAYPPHPRRPDPRVPGIVRDCEARLVLTTRAWRERLAAWRREEREVGALCWIATDDIADAASAERARYDAQALALLQYTSGSTTEPRGVRLTHANLLANLAQMHRRLALREGNDAVFWLPPFHDMGLIGGLLQPAYMGVSVALMSPASFLQRPLSWLEAISHYRATSSGAPNFAYDLCVDRSTPDERAALDLSAWSIALNGAEPVRADTLDRFARAFECAGFRREAFVPCYGLAEATLMVAGSVAPSEQAIVHVSRAALDAGRLEGAASAADATALVSCGAPIDEHVVRIVDVESGMPRDDGEVGEIWVAGPSVGDGYWRPRGDSSFDARLSGDERRWLRTGDLGALCDGRLFVTGRLKDLVIVGGRNLHPHDIERAAERSHGALRPGRSAAFADHAASDGERLVVVLEISRRAAPTDLPDVFLGVREAVARQVGVVPGEIVLVRQGTIPRTSSGKIRRAATRDALRAGALDVVARDGDAVPALAAGAARPTSREWLRRWLAQAVGTDVVCSDAMTLRDLGIESLDAVRLVIDAERELGVRLDTGRLWGAAHLGEIERLLDGAPLDAANDGVERSADPPEMLEVERRLALLQRQGLADPYFVPHDGIAGSVTRVDDRELVSFASYDYLGLAGDARVVEASVDATRRWGTSVSASRLVSGERAIHRELEQAIARFLGAEDALAFVSGHATNVTTIPCLVGEGDLVIADALAHDSIVQGARLSGARRLVFPHNDWAALDALLRDLRARYRRVLIVIEGVYSADGDIPDLPRFVEIKRRHAALLMVDEAHSLGVLGATGRGVLEHAGVAAGEVDVLMGTLSKALASCGGYIAGSARLVRYLRYAAPGFVFSVGLAPANAAAALAALRVLDAEPSRVASLHRNADEFLALARAAGVDVGGSAGTPVIPAIVGDSLRAIRVAARLRELGVSAPPMVAPSVPERLARLRFFVTARHEAAQLTEAAAALARALHECPA